MDPAAPSRAPTSSGPAAPVPPAGTPPAGRPPPPPPPVRTFARARRAVQLGVVALVVLAPFLDLIRIDVGAGALVVLGHALHPGKELWIVFGFLLVGLLWVFGGALIHGRLWCGWLCPQTLGSELAAAWRRVACGPKKGVQPPRAREALYVAGVVLGSALFSAAVVNWFLAPAQRLSPPAGAWVGLAVLTALLAADFLWVRHAYCLKICPYGVLLQLIQDPKTLRVVLADEDRATCLGCKACERACFMDVSVRDRDRRTEAACLLCGLCVDACDRVFTKRGREGILHFRFAQGRPGWPRWLSRIGLSDPRRLGLAFVTVGVALATVLLFRGREGLVVTARSRYAEAAVTADGRARNTVDVTLSNDGETALVFDVSVAGELAFAPPEPARLEVAAGARRVVPVVVSVAPGVVAPSGPHRVTVRLVPAGGGAAVEAATTFFVPSRPRGP
ncbi:MAG: 4Fe-4S binding protein [Planctomycetes bacterium]|nr:4Fe-4S binding protein [Planctomycetota bacterium]